MSGIANIRVCDGVGACSPQVRLIPDDNESMGQRDSVPAGEMQ